MVLSDKCVSCLSLAVSKPYAQLVVQLRADLCTASLCPLVHPGLWTP